MIFVAMHGFTSWFDDFQRPWHAGLLYDRDRRLAGILLHSLQADSKLVIGDNERYSGRCAESSLAAEEGSRCKSVSATS